MATLTLELDQFYSTEFGTNWEHLVQQSEGRVHGLCKRENFRGKRKMLPQIGKGKARLITTRNGATIPSDHPFAKRVLSLKPYDEVYHEDEWDKALLGEVSSPSSAVVEAHAMAFQRAMDEACITAATGTAYIGEEGTEPVDLPDTQIVGVQFGTSPSADIGLTLKKLIEVKSRLGKNEAVMNGEKIYFVHAQKQLDDLLLDAQITSGDYNKVKALYDGEINHFMGMEFIKTELVALDPATEIRTCFAFVPSGICFSANDYGVKFSIRDDLNETLQIRTKGRFNATRTQEEKVVAVECDENP